MVKKTGFGIQDLGIRSQEQGVRSQDAGGRMRGLGLNPKSLILNPLLFLLLTAYCLLPTAFAQQPQAQAGQEIYPVNAKFVQGFGPGYWPTAGSNLILNLAPGTAVCSNVVQTYAGGTLTLAPSATNYVYLDPTNNCAPASNTSSFPAGSIAIATVATTSAAISSVTDVRTPFVSGASGNVLGMGNGSTVVDASLKTGADWSVRVNAAIAACPSSGCTVDARGFTSPQTMSQSIDLKTPGGAVILWLPTGTINRSTGAQFEMESGAQVIGMSGTYIYNGNGDSGAVFANNTGGAVTAVYVRDVTMRSEGPFTVKDNSGNPHNVTYGTGTCFDLRSALSVELYHTQAICQAGLRLSDPSYDGSYYNTFIDNIFASTNPNGAAVLLGEFPNENNFYATKFIAYGSSAVFAQSQGGFVNFNGGDIEGTGAGVYIENGTNIGIHDVYFEAIGPNCSSFPYACWQANWPYVQGAVVAGSDGKSHVCVTAGTSGASAPTWNSTYGATTTDHTSVWRTVQYGQVVWGPGAVGNTVDGALGPQYIDNYSTYFGGTSNYQLIPPNVNGNTGVVPSNFTAGEFTLGSSLGSSTAAAQAGNFYVLDANPASGSYAGPAFEYTGALEFNNGYTGHSPLRVGGLLSSGGLVGTSIANQLKVIGLPNPGAPVVALFGSHAGTNTVSYALTAYCGGVGANTLPGSFTQITNAPSTPGALISATINAPGSGYQAGDVVAIGNYFTGFVGITGSATAYYTVSTVNGSGGVTAGSVTTAGSGYLDGQTNVGVTGGHGTGLTLSIAAYALVEISPSLITSFAGFGSEPWSGCAFDIIKDPAGGTSTAQYLGNSRPNMGNWWISGQLLDYGQSLSAYTPPSRNNTSDTTLAVTNLTSTVNFTGTQSWFGSGSNYFLDTAGSGGAFILGYNTVQTSSGGLSLQVYNHKNGSIIFDVNGAGSSGGADTVSTKHNTLEDGSGNMTATGKITSGAPGFCISSSCATTWSMTLNGTANQITSPGSTALGGTATFAIANPFTFPGKATGAASTTSAATFNVPTGSAPSSPASGDFWNLSGILQFYDGSHTNSLATLQAAPTSGHCAQFSGTAGLLADSGGSCGGGGMTWPTFIGLAAYGGSSNWVTPTYSSVTALFGSGSCSGYLKSDGTCSTPSGTISGLTTGYLPQATSSSAIGNTNPVLDNGITTANTLTYGGSGGVAAPQVSLTGSGPATLSSTPGACSTAPSSQTQLCLASSTNNGPMLSYNGSVNRPITPPNIVNFNTASFAPGQFTAATPVYITGSSLATPASLIQGYVVGTAWVWRVAGMVKNGNGTGALSFIIYSGTNGSTSDTAKVTQAWGAQTAVADVGEFDVHAVITSIVSGTATVFWSISPEHHLAATGFCTTAVGGYTGTFTFSTATSGLIFGLGIESASGGTMETITVATVEAAAYNLY